MDEDLEQWQSAWQQATPLGPVAQAEVLAEMLDADDGYADTTARRMSELIGGLAGRMVATGTQDLCQLDAADAVGFVRAPTRRGSGPSVATMHLRRTAVRLAAAQMRTLGLDVDDPTRQLTLPPSRPVGCRPMTAAELTLLRVTAAGRTRRRHAALGAVALSEAGATTGEVARLRWPSVDLDTGGVALPGAGRTAPRTVTLTPWGHRQLRRAVDDDGGGLVVYRGTADPDSDTAQAAITTRLRKLMDVAGLDDPDLRPGSVRLCLPAVRLADDGRVDRAARALGVGSLDVAARLLDWDWQAA